MKKIFFILLLFNAGYSDAQNTWVQKLSYNIAMNGYYDKLTGVRNIEIGPDGSAFVVATVKQNNAQRLFKFSPNSNQVEWSIDLGYHHATGPEWIEGILATSDSGVIVCHNFWYSNYPITGDIWKYSKTGLTEWGQHFFRPWPYDETTYDIIENNFGGYYALIQDSMFTLDIAGNVIDSSGTISGRRFMQMTNGDFLVLTGGGLLQRKDTIGNLIWSEICTGPFACDSSSVFIATSNTNVKKIDALTGAQLWNMNYGHSPISEIEATHDGGFIASVGYKPRGMYGSGLGAVSAGYLIRGDSLGDTLWTRSYPFPHFGLSMFRLMPNGNILTGGAYMSGLTLFAEPEYYSAFCCMMNSDGSFPLEQTDYVSPPDANNDHRVNFVEDALETMLAIGSTGIALDSSLDGNHEEGYNCDQSDISIDWPTFFANGVNHKYADCDANGIVDTNDVLCLNNFNCSSFPDSADVFYRLWNNDQTQIIEEFCFLPVDDTIHPGDDASYYMIMGNNANLVDSIYGFAFSYFIGENFMDHADYIISYKTDFGTPDSNMWMHHTGGFVTQNYLQRTHTLICRTDFQNAVNVSDTLGLVKFTGRFPLALFTPTIADFKAILVSGTDIPFNVCTGSIFIDSSSVSISEKAKNDVKISPIPADEFLNIQFSNSNFKNIVLFNSLGEKVKELKSTETITKIPVEDLPNGFYFGSIICENAIKNFSFVVQH